VKAKGQDQSELLAGIADRTWGLAIPLPQGYSNQLDENSIIKPCSFVNPLPLRRLLYDSQKE